MADYKSLYSSGGGSLGPIAINLANEEIDTIISSVGHEIMGRLGSKESPEETKVSNQNLGEEKDIWKEAARRREEDRNFREFVLHKLDEGENGFTATDIHRIHGALELELKSAEIEGTSDRIEFMRNLIAKFEIEAP